MSLIQTVQPAEEPVSLVEARAHLRVDHYDDDALIRLLITGARERAEQICRRALVTQSWKLILDEFPRPGASSRASNLYGEFGITPGPLTTIRADRSTGFEIVPGMPTLQSVEAIKYIDAGGNQQTLDPSQYKVDPASVMGRIVPAYGTQWPTTRAEISAVEVDFTCGYGAAVAVPRGIKNWILIMIATLYENREAVAILPRGKVEPLPFVDRILDPYRVLGY
jgi:uncharacterized phiE125 gp8 family phage protein